MTTYGEFYIAGGTLQRDAPCYVSREADTDLYNALSAGHFAYVLTSRQMGKSSLMVRTAARLREQHHTVALIDLTAIGQNVTPEQWYTGIIGAIAEQIGVEDAVAARWRDSHALSPLQRWQKTMRELVARGGVASLIVFIDEIDAVRSLPFSTDEFFAAMRELYNRRAEEPDLERLTFCLLGVASPADLIRDTRTTPFNIGTRIELDDFTFAEARGLLPGLAPSGRSAEAILARVLHWTGGHPYLTQRLCQALAADASMATAAHVDRCCTDLFLSSRARDRDDNLLFVRERLLGAGGGLSEVLEVVDRVRDGRRVADDEQNPWVDLVRLSGITRTHQGTLRIRNRIYARVFSAEWVRSSLPGADRRRQRAAYRRGVWRASLVAAAVIAVMGVLGALAVQQRDRAVAQEAVNAQLLYAAEMNLAQQAWSNGDGRRVLHLLDKNVPRHGRTDPRGFEWYYLWRATHAYRRAFVGHTEAVTAFDLSPDGQRLVTGSWDGTAKIWDFATGGWLRTLSGGDANLVAVAFSPDGRLVATAGTSLRLWDAISGAPIAVLRGHASRVNDVAFAPDGTTLASASWDRSVRLWDVAGSREIRRFDGHTKRVNSIAFAPDGRSVVSGSGDGTVRLWTVDTGRADVVVNHTDNDIQSVEFSPDGRWIAVAGWLDGVELWDMATRRLATRLRGHNAMVASTSFSPDGRALVTGGLDGTARMWSLPSGEQTGTVTVNAGTAVSAVRFASAREFLTGGKSNAAEVWDVGVNQQAEVLRAHTAPVSSLAFSPDGQVLATGSWEGAAKLWQVDTGTVIATMPHGRGRVQRVAFSGDGSKLTVSGTEPGTEVWDPRNGQQLGTLPAAFNPLFSPDGRRIVARAAGGAQWWEGSDWRPSRLVQSSPEWGLMAVSPDGRLLVVTRHDGMMQVWDAASLQVRRTWRAHADAIAAVVFAPDASVMATASLDGTIKLWRGFTELATLAGHKGWVNALAFSPDGRRLASGSLDETVKIWDAEHHHELMTLSGHRGSVMAVAFSPAGDMLASGGDDRTVRLWRASRPR